jgi:hypothetical protein
LLRRLSSTDFQIKSEFWLKEEGASDEDEQFTKPYQMASYFLR